VTLDAAGGVTTTTITASGGAGTGAGTTGGNAANITVNSNGAISTTALAASGGNAGAGGNSAGGNAGTITLDAGGGSPITLGGNLTATGGNSAGVAAAGAGALIWMKDPVLLNAGPMTIAAGGGSAGVGAGGNVQFDSAVDSTGGARALTVNTNATTIFGGVVGTGAALLSLTTDAGGTTQMNGGAITTTGAHTYNDPVTLGAATNLTANAGTITVASTLGAGANALTVTANGINFSGGVGSISGSSTITLQPTADNVSVGVAGGAGTLQLTAADINALANGFSGITIGRAGGTATTTVNAASFADPVLIQQGGAGGAIMVNGLITGTTNASITLTAPGSITFNGAGVTTADQNVNVNGPVTLATGAVAINAGSGDVGFSSTVDGGQALTVNSTGTTAFGGAVGGGAALTSLTTNAGGTTAINGGSVTTTGAQSYGDNVTLGANTTLTSNSSGNISFAGTVTNAVARTLAVNTSGTTTFTGAVGGGATALSSLTTDAGGTTAINGGSIATTGNQTYNDAVTTSVATTLTGTSGGNITANNTGNNFNGNLILSTSGTASIVDSNALSLGASSVGTLTAQTLAGDLTLNGAITATGAGDSIVLAAAQNFVNNVGAGALSVPGSGRWLVFSTSPAGSIENGLTGAAGSAMPRLYNRTFASYPPVAESGNHLIYSSPQSLTVTPDNKSKVYGANDPAQTYTAAGYITDDGVTDTATTAGLAGSFGRVAGESVAAGPYLINQGSFASSGGYGITFISGNTLTINPAALSIRADDTSRPEAMPNPAFTATYSGLQFADTPASLAGALGFSTPAIISSPAGPYPITPFGQSSTNYAITYVNGTLVVGSGSVVPPPGNATTPSAASLSPFVNPIFQAVNFWVPDLNTVAYSTDESVTALPPTAAGPADGAESVAQFGEQPSHRNQSDWQCLRYAIWTKLLPHYCGL
jgi:hypothetical protein